MPAKDLYHEKVRVILEQDGWTITDDPFKLKWGLRELFVDLGATKLIAAQKAERKIAVEIKSFVKASPVTDLEAALGQYILYQNILEEIEPNRQLYLAIRQATYREIFSEPIGSLVLTKNPLHLLVFDPHKEIIAQWID
ncbi:MAG: element excision factor XisH family protein [Coleofasciculus sp. G3-WIS-01]|uniref:element excision factor XisH family protein n=1 Tax=Coleofasciculus sp. G3-WIS-01 TaxID=3069528 RepID=UPI0032FA34DD